ncbi:helix-turn-helix domain-containing protein [Phenylobacterium sp.]|uniref:helix-turn-helix domain-containing protein n=1 Tax=Phenylobacterium sp. TaxID=1871053 RepID=UPI003949DB53
MSESSDLISAFVHGVAGGFTLITAVALLRSRLSRDVRLAGALFALAVVGWLVNESRPLWVAFGEPYPVFLVACGVAGVFWLFVLAVFADMKVNALTLAPAVIMLASGLAMGNLPQPGSDLVWAARNLASALLALHAGSVVLRGWSGDLVEGRRRFRALLLSLACLFVLLEVGVAFTFRLTHDPAWLQLAVGRTYGGLIMALLSLALAVLMLRPDPAVFGAARKPAAAPDARAEAADRQLLARLDALMAAEEWRREGLTIGDLARELDVPEHRLRRLINQRLGHRNFADFVNGHRIEAAKRRLADPAEARTTVAVIAFDLGYGSLGPFNRAFRAATGATPTEWRRQALNGASPNPSETA